MELVDVNQLLTYEKAARAFRVRVDTIRMWKVRGHLEVATDETGRELYIGRSPLFRRLDVALAEQATREGAGRIVPIAA